MKSLKFSVVFTLALGGALLIAGDSWAATTSTPTSTPSVTPTSTPASAPTSTPTSTPTPTPTSTPTPPPATASLTVRYQDKVVFDQKLTLPTSTTFDYHETGTTTISSTSTSHASVLAAVVKADQTSSNFAISDLVYYPSFSSFLLNCITISTPSSTKACFNWKYVVDDSFPAVGMDRYLLTGNESIYLFFGDREAIVPSQTSYELGQTVTATHKQYDYKTGTFSTSTTNLPKAAHWLKDSMILATSTLASDGTTSFIPTSTGAHKVGIQKGSAPWAYYSPTASFVVTSTASSTTGGSSGSGSGGSGGGTTASSQLDVPKAIAFLDSLQNSDGSFGYFEDWVAIAYGAYESANSGKTKLKNYLLTDPSAGSLTTDYERRAMALMSLGVSPYDGTKTNYIAKIVDQFKDGQFGDKNLINDDIFALFPLLKAGYSSGDKMIISSTAFILAEQNSDGSWTGGVDMTAAAIQALSLVDNLENVKAGVDKAKDYLKNKQADNGSFGNNVASTAWAMQGIAALDEKAEDWKKSKTAHDYLADQQATDGGTDSGAVTSTRIWNTAYSIPATLEKTWSDILQSFTAPVASTGSGSGSGVGGFQTDFIDTTSTTSTTTVPTTTSTTTPTTTTATTTTAPTVPEDTEPTTTSAVAGLKIEAEPVAAVVQQPTPVRAISQQQTISTVNSETDEIKPNPITADEFVTTTETVTTTVSQPNLVVRDIFFLALGLAIGLIAHLAWRSRQNLV